MMIIIIVVVKKAIVPRRGQREREGEGMDEKFEQR